MGMPQCKGVGGSVAQGTATRIWSRISMKTITVNVSESVYAEYRRAAAAMGRPTSELIREAMEAYRQSILTPRHDVSSFTPVSLGATLQPLEGENDLLDDILHGGAG